MVPVSGGTVRRCTIRERVCVLAVHQLRFIRRRNLLQEFTPRNEKFQPGGENVKAYRQMLKNRRRSEPIVALVGFREWIFSGKVRHRESLDPAS